jgi:hypothetical protein
VTGKDFFFNNSTPALLSKDAETLGFAAGDIGMCNKYMVFINKEKKNAM